MSIVDAISDVWLSELYRFTNIFIAMRDSFRRKRGVSAKASPSGREISNRSNPTFAVFECNGTEGQRYVGRVTGCRLEFRRGGAGVPYGDGRGWCERTAHRRSRSDKDFETANGEGTNL